MQCAHRPNPQAFRSPRGVEQTGDFPRWCGSQIHELTSGLGPVIVVLSQDLSGAWVTVSG
jgi:hypothetical protein